MESVLEQDARDFEMKMDYVTGERTQLEALMEGRLKAVREGLANASFVAEVAAFSGDFDSAGEMLQLAVTRGNGLWTYPLYIRLPEQAPHSPAWQAFWSKPRIAELAALRRSHGFSAQAPTFGSATAP
jgi:hypothetical protein